MGGWPFSLISLFVPLFNYLLWFETIIWRVLYTFDLLYSPTFIPFYTLFTFLPRMFLYLYSRFSQQCFSTCIHVSPNNVSLPVFTFLPTMFLYLYSRFSQQCFSTCIHVSPNNVSLPVFTFLPTMFLYLYSHFSQQCFSTCIPKH